MHIRVNSVICMFSTQFGKKLVAFSSLDPKLLLVAASLCGSLLVSGCISSTTSLDVRDLQIVHQDQPVDASNESTNVLLVEREDGGLVVVTDKQLFLYDEEFNLEHEVDFEHKYYGFGLIQGPSDTPWFAGYEWWSWMFGILHNMNFEVHAMPLGETKPTFAWPCKNCSDLRVQRFAEPMQDYLYAASVRRSPPWVAFDVASGTRFGTRTYSEMVEVLAEDRLGGNPIQATSAGKRVGNPYASLEWWRYAYATCASGSRILWGMQGGTTRNCVWHPQRANRDAEFIVRLDGTYQRIVLTEKETGTEADSWELSELVEVLGFSNVIGWFRYPDSGCLETGGGTSKSQACSTTMAVVSGTWENCYEETRCEEVTGVFELEDGGHARLIKLIPAPSRAAVRLMDGRIVVSAGHNLVLFDPPSAPPGDA